MYILLVSIVIGLFVAMLFVNVYFRAKVLKVYGVLVRNKVEFGAAHVFNREKLEKEIVSYRGFLLEWSQKTKKEIEFKVYE